MIPNLSKLPTEEGMRKYLRETLPRIKPKKRKIIWGMIKVMYRSRRITKEQYEDAEKEFKALEGK